MWRIVRADANRGIARLVAIALVALLVAGCAGSGSATPIPSTAGDPGTAAFVLASGAFDPGGAIPARFTCDGEDVSPDLTWSGAPAATRSLVLVVDDPDANGFVHWIAFDIPGAADGTLPLGLAAAAGAPPQGTNDFGRVGWNGPCPPSGVHRYRFTLTALVAPLGLTGTPDKAAVSDALGRAAIVASTTLEGTYQRP